MDTIWKSAADLAVRAIRVESSGLEALERGRDVQDRLGARAHENDRDLGEREHVGRLVE